MPFTYRQLRDLLLRGTTEEQLDQNVTVNVNGELVPVHDYTVTLDSDVVDDDTIILETEEL